MRVVIPVAVEPRNLSLPHAINSIRKHTDYEPVTVGHDHGLCENIPAEQAPGRANVFANTAHLMQVTIDTLAEPFIWSADDIYWLRPAEPVRWALGQLECDFGPTIYQKRKHTTWCTLRAHSLPTYDYESHTPLPVTNLAAMNLALNMTGAMRTLYGNLTGDPDTIAGDVKIRSRRDPIPDAPWASSNGNPELWPALMAAL